MGKGFTKEVLLEGSLEGPGENCQTGKTKSIPHEGKSWCKGENSGENMAHWGTVPTFPNSWGIFRGHSGTHGALSSLFAHLKISLKGWSDEQLI